ncbi:MAG: (Fe-S)-binding protein [Syntrophobacteraceae bacterium]|jgi:ArsR family metal-binding transcriptional regulator
MLLSSYTKEFVRLSCGSSAQPLDLIAHLNQDISEVIPYLNAVLGGFQYTKDPRSVSLRLHGKLVVIHPREICINAPSDQSEGEKIIEWLQEKINDTWERRGEIQPRFESAPKPKMLEILRLLPKTNCGECGHPTCMVFASHVAEAGKGPDDCPSIDGERRTELETYLRQCEP